MQSFILKYCKCIAFMYFIFLSAFALSLLAALECSYCSLSFEKIKLTFLEIKQLLIIELRRREDSTVGNDNS